MKEIELLQDVRSELESGGQEIRVLSERVAILSDGMYSNYQWILLAHFPIAISIFIFFILWQCRAHCILEQKLNTIQAALSTSHGVPISAKSKSSTKGTIDVGEIESCTEILNHSYLVESSHKSDLNRHNNAHILHARSLSFPSTTDLHRRAENIGGLSRPEINTYLATQRRDGGGPLSSQSLSSLDNKRISCEVGENSNLTPIKLIILRVLA